MNELHVLVIGTGGTIAGTASAGLDDGDYTAAQLGVDQIVSGLAPLGVSVHTQQTAQIDSKDMSAGVWCDLTEAVLAALQSPWVTGIVITHGTDTLEETATWLSAVLPSELAHQKPVALTCAMRPASSAEADGPANLRDALFVASAPDSHALRGVLLVCAGFVHAGSAVRKVHSHRLEAFSSGDAGPWAKLDRTQGCIQLINSPDFGINCPYVTDFIEFVATDFEVLKLLSHVGQFGLPWVEIIHSHADASGKVIDALIALGPRGPQGFIVAATGNGTVHANLERSLLAARAQGIHVWRSTRCVLGAVTARADDVLPHTPLPPAKARVVMQVEIAAKSLRSRGKFAH